VDDSAMNRDLMERALAQEGANTTLAADGQQAVQFLKTRPEAFNAVLMDIQMPVMDGLTAIQLIRGDLGLADLPIIAFTAGVSKEQQAAARAAGANDVLAKPMDLEQMAVMLSEWIKPSQISTQVAQTSTGINTIKDFPDIAGIDKDRAAKRLSGDRDMFISLLEMFFDDNINTAKLTQDDLTSGDRDMAARRMHTLVSNAGFICALDIMESAKELEQAIDQGDGETALNVRLETLDRQITKLVEASKPWRPTTKNSHPK
jgi:CheY-like chemotaxis protein/HPt (histidine-containing phosphotransfer) domain-containing protein